MMTIKELYSNYLESLQKVYTAKEADIIASWVFESITETSRSGIITDPSKKIGATIVERLKNSLIQLLEHKPIQYVLGEAWFYKLKLRVNEHVLIPRPETEELVQWIIQTVLPNDLIPGKDVSSLIGGPSILDIGTGSGCIAIAIKNNLPLSIVTAIDISVEALHIATENAATLKAAVSFLPLNFLDESAWKQLPGFDIIVSNPPYIPLNEKEKLARNVKDFEPAEALFVPDNSPLLFYEKIALFAKVHGNTGGRIYIETHEEHAGKVASLFKETFKEVVIKKDIFGKDRMVMALI